jgi:hypothetical protein
MLPSVANLRLGGGSVALRPETVECAECGCTLDEDEAQAVRWGWWSAGLGELYPFCERCARREFAPDAPASQRVLLVDRRDR